jgi:hypothetical protein
MSLSPAVIKKDGLSGIRINPGFSEGESPEVLADIYNDGINITTWRRTLNRGVEQDVNTFLSDNPNFQRLVEVNSETALNDIKHALGEKAGELWLNDMAELVEMFCCLFGVNEAGLRLTATNSAMCPKFHVDHVICRLVTTYQGVATQWLPHYCVDRSKLGRGSAGLNDHESGLYQSESDIQQADCGDIVLLKGERWEGNEGAGIVHRSPEPPAGGYRLVCTLDFIS